MTDELFTDLSTAETVEELKEIILYLSDRIDQLEAEILQAPLAEDLNDAFGGTEAEFDNPDQYDWSEINDNLDWLRTQG